VAIDYLIVVKLVVFELFALSSYHFSVADFLIVTIGITFEKCILAYGILEEVYFLRVEVGSASKNDKFALDRVMQYNTDILSTKHGHLHCLLDEAFLPLAICNVSLNVICNELWML
jgi:hypothetical protein